MGVKYTHPEYDEMLPRWKRCRDVSAGQDAIHAAGEAYLAKLADQTTCDYNSYKNRTPFYNGTWRTIVGLQGMLFRKPPTVVIPASVTPMLKDVTLSGVPFQIFALEAAEECLTVGRVGVFVDYPIVDMEHATAADAMDANVRPLLKIYKAESIINWKSSNIDNSYKTSMVVLAENKLSPKDEFEDAITPQYRVLDLFSIIPDDDNDIHTVYRVRVFEVQNIDGKEVDILISEVIPMMNGEPLEYIPFYFMSVDDVGSCVDEPPLIDLVDMNLSHYRTTADYEHGCHFTGLPTPVISGYQPDKEGEKFYIGSMTAWVFPRPDAKASYLEFKGEGLNALEKNLARKEMHMAILGARMLEAQSKGVESAETASIYRSGEQSMLASVAQSLSIGFQKALETFCAFANASGEVSVEINRDFFPMSMDALTLTALIAGWQNSAISYDTLFDNLRRGEIIKADQTLEEEQASIKANPPPAPDVGTTPGSASPNAAKLKASGTGKDPSITQLQHK